MDHFDGMLEDCDRYMILAHYHVTIGIFDCTVKFCNVIETNEDLGCIKTFQRQRTTWTQKRS